jgi:hypothetical protein
MKWVSILKRKPKTSGYYYWKGKINYGGRAYYDEDVNYFDFDESIPANKVDEEQLYWLDEEIAEYEEQIYSEAKKLVNNYENEQLNKYAVLSRFYSLDECENEAILFTKEKMKVVCGLLSEDYKIGYKEGIEHYLASKNDL